jgi:hypothetical protein
MLINVLWGSYAAKVEERAIDPAFFGLQTVFR